MIARLRELLDWVDGLTLRERAIIGLGALLVLWGGWTVLSWDALEAQRLQASSRLERARAGLEEVAQRSAAVLAAEAADPDHDRREERRRLERQLASLEGQLAERAGQLISPEEMVTALRRLLAEQRGLTLDRFELQPPVSAIEESDPQSAAAQAREAAADLAAPDLYKHVVEIEWRGNYFDTLRYLRAVEGLGFALYWESLDYEVVAHPEGRVRLRLFTLSEQEGWIGV